MWSTIKMIAVCIGLGVPAGLIGVPWTLLTKDVSLLYRWGTGIAAIGVAAAGIAVDVQGYENVPAGRACVFLCNHVSNLDPPVLLPKIPGRASVMLKKSLMGIPLLGPAMKLGRFVAVERGSRSSALESLRLAQEAITSGLHMLIFVEGTRSRTGRLLPFKKGPFHVAEQTGAPIIPTVIYGTETMLQRGSWAIRGGTAHVRFLEAIDPAAYPERDALMEAVRNRMIAALPEPMRPEAI